MSKKNKKKKKKKYIKYDKYESIELYSFRKEWMRVFEQWDGKTHKKYKNLPVSFIDEISGKKVINKKKKSLRPLDVFLLETYPDIYTTVKTETDEERVKRRDKILKKQTKKFDKMKNKQDDKLWEAIDYSLKHPDSNKEKLTKSEQKIMDFFNKRNGVDKKRNKEIEKKDLEKYNSMNLFEFKAMVEIEELKELKRHAGKKGWAYGYNKKGKRVNPNKGFGKRQMQRYDNDKSKHAVNVFKETLIDEIEARLLFDPFSIDKHPVIDYNKYSENINKNISDKKKNKQKEKNRINMGMLTI